MIYMPGSKVCLGTVNSSWLVMIESKSLENESQQSSSFLSERKFISTGKSLNYYLYQGVF